MTFPTADAIRAMDGPTLTRLAFDLGLTPESYVILHNQYYSGDNIWEPHSNVRQARTLFFDRLAAQGWLVRLDHWGAQGAGTCSAIWYGVPGRASPLTLLTSYGHPTVETQALALLRCACLAERLRQYEEIHG